MRLVLIAPFPLYKLINLAATSHAAEAENLLDESAEAIAVMLMDAYVRDVLLTSPAIGENRKVGMEAMDHIRLAFRDFRSEVATKLGDHFRMSQQHMAFMSRVKLMQEEQPGDGFMQGISDNVRFGQHSLGAPKAH